MSTCIQTHKNRTTSNPVSTEGRLLTLCARADSDPAVATELAGILKQDIVWERFLKLVDRNEVWPLAANSLAAFASCIPKGVLYTLHKQAEFFAAWNLRLTSELISLFELFGQNAIRAVPYKGPALAMALYGRISSRQCRDLDIFIDRGHLTEIVRLMAERHFHPVEAYSIAGESQLTTMQKDLRLESTKTGIAVELHWAVFEPLLDPRLQSWSPLCSRSTISMWGASLPVPGPEDMLFLLSLHGIRHYWSSFKWICDIDRLLRVYPSLDWNRSLTLAGSFDRQRTLLLPLILTQDLLSSPLTHRMEQCLNAEKGLRLLSTQIAGKLFDETDQSLPQPHESLLVSKKAADTDIRLKVVRISATDGAIHRLKFFISILWDFLQPDLEDHYRRPVLSKMRVLYWLIQPVRLLRAHGLGFFFQTSRQLLRSLLS